MRQLLFGLAAVSVLWAGAGSAAAFGPTKRGCDSCNGDCAKFDNGYRGFDRWTGGDPCAVSTCQKIKDILCWWKKPCPSPAPFLRQQDVQLAFPSHPYIRSPRDYFMDP